MSSFNTTTAEQYQTFLNCISSQNKQVEEATVLAHMNLLDKQIDKTIKERDTTKPGTKNYDYKCELVRRYSAQLVTALTICMSLGYQVDRDANNDFYFISQTDYAAQEEAINNYLDKY